MNEVETKTFTKEELYRMNNDSKYGFNWINLAYVNNVNPINNIIKYKIYPTGNVKNIIIGREYIAFPESKVLDFQEKSIYNII